MFAEQIKLFKKDKPKEKNGKSKPKFEAVIDGFGVETIERTSRSHECFACNLPIAIGSKVEKQTPIVNDRPQWQYAKYRHLPACPPPEDEPVF